MFPSRGSRLYTSALAAFGRIVHQSAGRCLGVVREHWLFAVLAGCATVLRVVVQLAYQPALIFPDSRRYLEFTSYFIGGHWSPDWLRDSGYSLLLIPAVLIHNLAVVAAGQHLLGLAAAVLIYATLVHLGAGWPRWRPFRSCSTRSSSISSSTSSPMSARRSCSSRRSSFWYGNVTRS